MNVSEPYRIFSEFYDDFIAKNCPDLHEKYYHFLTELIDKNSLPHGSMLDATCGTGILMKTLSDAGYGVTGMDINEHMLSKARQKGLDVFRGDIRNFDVGHKYDVIYSFDSLGHMTRDGELEDAFDSVCRNLKPSGVFVFDVDSKDGLNRMVNETYSYDSPSFSFAWINHEIDDGFIDVELKIKKNQGGNVDELVEHHLVRGYGLDEIEIILEKTGFYITFQRVKPDVKDRSILFTTRKK